MPINERVTLRVARFLFRGTVLTVRWATQANDRTVLPDVELLQKELENTRRLLESGERSPSGEQVQASV